MITLKHLVCDRCGEREARTGHVGEVRKYKWGKLYRWDKLSHLCPACVRSLEEDFMHLESREANELVVTIDEPGYVAVGASAPIALPSHFFGESGADVRTIHDTRKRHFSLRFRFRDDPRRVAENIAEVLASEFSHIFASDK